MLNHFKNILIYIEIKNQAIQKVSLELIGKGKFLADKLGVKLQAVVIGYQIKNLAPLLFEYGVEQVFIMDACDFKNYETLTFTNALVTLIQSKKPEIVLMGATLIGKDLAPRVSARLDTGLTADCTELDIDLEKRILLQTRPAFAGNILATIICPSHRPQIATVRSGVFDIPPIEKGRKGSIEEITIKVYTPALKIIQINPYPMDNFILSEAKIIVAGGKGVGSQQNFQLLKQLAAILKAEIGATRAAVDAGYITKEHQIGQTGITVKPDLYIACGISGSVQHLSGILNSKTIIAINKDPNANIFNACDFGIIGDFKEVIPALIQEINAQVTIL